jgi:hypothetical protein
VTRPTLHLRRGVTTVILGVIFLITGGIAGLFAMDELGRPLVYRMPGDYRGWVAIRYEDPACAPLRKDLWYVVVEVGSDGRVCTSSPVPGGWRYVRYEYVYPDGRRRQLGANERVEQYGATGPQKPQVGVVFVGSEEEQRSAQLMNDVVNEMLTRTRK